MACLASYLVACLVSCIVSYLVLYLMSYLAHVSHTLLHDWNQLTVRDDVLNVLDTHNALPGHCCWGELFSEACFACRRVP